MTNFKRPVKLMIMNVVVSPVSGFNGMAMWDKWRFSYAEQGGASFEKLGCENALQEIPCGSNCYDGTNGPPKCGCPLLAIECEEDIPSDSR